MASNRLLTLSTRLGGQTVKEQWRFDSWEINDSEALHTVLTIRDPGERYSVRFTSPKNGFPEGSVRLL